VAETPPPLPEDRFLLAGEHALGVLEGQERAEAQRLLLNSRRFADAVAWWEHRLGAMGEAAEPGEISPQVWQAIEARIDALGDNRPAPLASSPAKTSRFGIAALATGAGLAAASLILFLATPSPAPQAPVVPQPASPQLIAQIADAEAGRKIAGLIDRRRGLLKLDIEGLDAGEGQTPELWAIPAGGAPISLGAIPENGVFERRISASEKDLLIEGASLAVTFEEKTGERHAEPTPPILLVGELDEV